MPVRIGWLLEERVAYSRSLGAVTVAEMHWWDARAVSMMEASSAAHVHAILNHAELVSQPNILQLRSLQSALHPKVGWVVHIQAPNSVVKFIGSTVAQLLGVKIRYEDTLEAALAYLQTVDPTLPDLATLPLPEGDYFDSTQPTGRH